MRRLLLSHAVLALAGAASAGPALACAICLSALEISPGERLDNADRALLAVPDGADGWRIVADIKGSAPVDPAALADAAPSDGARSKLFLRDALGHRWSALGEVAETNAAWLRKVALTPAPDGKADDAAAQWRARLALAVQELRSDDPQIEAIAHGDLARAPYPVILDLGRAMTTPEILQHLRNEAHPAHRAAYIHMLGATGDEAAEAWLDGRLDRAWQSRDASDLAALLAADLELRGPSRIGRIEERYFLDRSRGLDEIEAALLALRLHGEADAAVPRGDVAAAYRRFLRSRPPMAGFVAMDLAAWEEWSATAEYVTLLNAGAIPDPAGAFAALSYVQRSPDTAAASKLELPDG
ncbi:hypothetical protein [Amaricoccus solimangrovi]|uniref:Uncharacterized protein n=1 Tax=Amaricoccus solimangrovi TaxID=2589815 RepID=A0A501WN87_9RHOB|nr:hypothetical protein [Amaricoccus solimangrovi]TPE49664.1 hypothetical protein FJM51_13510 [Amaricoccus solimangrovi]